MTRRATITIFQPESRKVLTSLRVIASPAQAPFGGVKASSFGREGGHFGLEEYLDVKYVSLGGIST